MQNKPTAKSVRQTSIGRMLNQLTRRLNTDMQVELGKIGLNMNGFFVLMNLLQNESITQAELGNTIGLPAYGMTRIIDSLEGLNLVERRADPNSRRNHLLFLTPEGHAIAPEIFAIVKKVNDKLLHGLPVAERQQFADTLAKLL